MGFFSKLWKKVKKGFKGIFKGIGKGLKKLLKGFGKFMGKIGIVGQLAMSFILPGIGGMLSKTLGKAFGGLTGKLLGSKNILLKGAGKMLEAGGNFAKMGHSAFKTVTDGVSSFVTEMGQAALSNIPGIKTILPNIKHKSFKAAWNNVEQEFLDNTGKVLDNFNNLIGKNVPSATASQAAAVAKAQAVTGEGISSTAEVKGFDMSTVGPDGKPLQEPFYPTPDGTLNVAADKPFYPTPSGEMPGILDAAGLETVGPDGLALNKKPFYPTPDGTLKAATSAATKQPSLLDKAIGVAKKTGTAIIDEVKQAPYKIPEYAGELASDAIKSEITTAIVGEEQPVEEYASSGYVMPYEEVTVGQYQSQAINDRAYQMAVDPVGYGQQNPFGYPAQDFYKQQMLAFTRPQPIG